jgi:type VI secretion system protein ImpK
MPSSSPPRPAAPAEAEPSARRGQLALALQEVLTATVRLRSNKQVATDAESFRQHVKQVMAGADQEARRAGYAPDLTRLALYAVVAFLDESVLNSTQPMFMDWARKPLQDEIFGGHLGGELFFQNVQALLAQPDSEDLADLLEVYQLCMLLGFHGRYSVSHGGELQNIIRNVADKIARVRGDQGELSPSWAPPSESIASAGRDPWMRWLRGSAISLAVVAVVLFVIYKLMLRGGSADLQTLASQIVR